MAPEELKAWRKNRNLNQVQAAEMFDRDVRTWQRWENGKQPIPSVIQRLIAIIDKEN